ncbi:MAG: hypothetical protein HYV09_18130 [Deltaproteobacteria bacterium]|nr:hypothetical protein [Deltaproteobacteria bacterium]
MREALGVELEGATTAKEWALVGQLARELEARRLARSAAERQVAGVVDLDAVRSRRG